VPNDREQQVIILRALFLYGDAANAALCKRKCVDIESCGTSQAFVMDCKGFTNYGSMTGLYASYNLWISMKRRTP
jgi:hypothetical protein